MKIIKFQTELLNYKQDVIGLESTLEQLEKKIGNIKLNDKYVLPFERFNLKGVLLELFEYDKDKKQYKHKTKGFIDGPNIRNDIVKVFDLYERSNYFGEINPKEYVLDKTVSLIKITGLLIDFSGKKMRFKVETNTMLQIYLK